ncbi:MAG: PHP-associated domain-containing protein [Chloroflexota bacterium]
MARTRHHLDLAQLGKADLHIHSAAGDGVNTIREILDHVEANTDLDVIAITDHDEVAGALEAQKLTANGDYSFEVIPGSEVTTREGHLLALFIEQRLPMLRSLRDTVAAVHALGGICVVPHPMSWLTLSVGRSRLLGIHNCPEEDLYLDGIEVFNPTIAGRVAVQRAVTLNRAHLRLAETGGSDAHHAELIGTGHTLFPGRTAADVRRALSARTSSGAGRYWTPADHLHGAANQQMRAMVVHPYRKVARAIQGQER